MITVRDPFTRSVAGQLRAFADEALLTQTELASRTGISQSQISKLLRAERHMTLAQLHALCGALGLSVTAVVSAAATAADRA